MHRTFTIAVPTHLSAQLGAQLKPLEGVISVALYPNASLKPVGDIMSVQVLNREADEVLRRIQTECEGTAYSITTAEQASFIDPANKETVANDVDEAIWEEMETGLRHQGRITSNFLALMGLGGSMATVGLVSEPAPQAMAFIAASIISPGFEPIAKIPLGIVTRKAAVVWRGLLSVITGYAVLVGAAALTFAILLALGTVSTADFVNNPEVKHLADPTALELTMSACGALAGGLIIASYRRSVIAGALIAVVLIHAASMIGVAIVCNRWDLAGQGMERFLVDMLVVIIGCGLVFGAKQLFVHRRNPIV